MCSVLSDQELNRVNELTEHIIVPADDIICEEGETAESIFNIVSGCLRVSKMLSDGRRQIIGFLFPGDYFGLAGREGYSYSAESITDLELCQMPREQLFFKLQEYPKLGQKLLDITKNDLQKAQEHMLLLGRKKAKEKLCSFLLLMMEKSQQIENNDAGKIYLPMSRSDIADYLGLTVETVSRQFTLLAKETIISIEDNISIMVLNEKQLRLISSNI